MANLRKEFKLSDTEMLVIQRQEQPKYISASLKVYVHKKQTGPEGQDWSIDRNAEPDEYIMYRSLIHETMDEFMFQQ